MNMILLRGGVPWPVSIRGNKLGRKRYLTALRHANREKPESLAALIALRTIEIFQEVDENLALAGEATIWSEEI